MSSLPTKPVLTEAVVTAAVDAARRRAIELGSAVTVVVVDDSATPRALLRMDGADLLTVGLASGKARLVAANGMPTRPWRGLVADDPFLGATLPTALDRLLGGAVLFGGGYPIVVDGAVIGGIGVSGGAEPDDDDVARTALTAIEDAEQFSAESA